MVEFLSNDVEASLYKVALQIKGSDSVLPRSFFLSFSAHFDARSSWMEPRAKLADDSCRNSLLSAGENISRRTCKHKVVGHICGA